MKNEPSRAVIKVIFFDFGDTLADSRIFTRNADRRAIEETLAIYPMDGDCSRYLPLAKRAWEETGQKMEDSYYRGRPLSKVDSQLAGESAIGYFSESLIHLMGQSPDPDAVQSLSQAYLRGIATADALFPEVRKTIETLSKRFGLGIISDNMEEFVVGPLRHFDLERFFEAVIISGCEGEGIIKPNPEIFLRALRALKVQPQEALMVGDTLEADVVGAHNVGMVTVWIDRSKKRISGKIKPDHTIADVSQLLQILDR